MTSREAASRTSHPAWTEHTWEIQQYELSRDRKTVSIAEKCTGCSQRRSYKRPRHKAQPKADEFKNVKGGGE